MDEQPGQFNRAARNAYPVDAHAHRARRPAPAFTLIEILIVVVIIGILAAIVVPQFSNASHVARENSLKDDLRYLRTQIAVYKAQHRDVPPGYPAGPTSTPNQDVFKVQMTGTTNDQGGLGTGRQYPLGPYLLKMPPNPLTQATGIKIIPAGTPLPKYPSFDDEKVFGWIYKPDTLEIIANSKEKDGRGRPYMEY